MKLDICETLASGLVVGWGCGHFTNHFRGYEVFEGITMGDISIAVGVLAILTYAAKKSIDEQLVRKGHYARRKDDKTTS